MTTVILALVCFVLFTLPFLLSYIHTHLSQRTPPLWVYYRFFVTFNVIFSGAFVAMRMLLAGQSAAQISGWAYSPMTQLFAVTVLSLVFLAVFTAYQRNLLAIAPAMSWMMFMLLSSAMHVYQLYQHTIADSGIMTIHILYNIGVAIVLMQFIRRLKQALTAEVLNMQAAASADTPHHDHYLPHANGLG